MENQFFVSVSLYPARYYATPRHNPRSDFYKNGLKSSARLEGKKSRSFSAKNNNRQRYNKKMSKGGGFHPPGSFRVKSQKFSQSLSVPDFLALLNTRCLRLGKRLMLQVIQGELCPFRAILNGTFLSTESCNLVLNSDHRMFASTLLSIVIVLFTKSSQIASASFFNSSTFAFLY